MTQRYAWFDFEDGRWSLWRLSPTTREGICMGADNDRHKLNSRMSSLALDLSACRTFTIDDIPPDLPDELNVRVVKDALLNGANK